MEYTKEQKINKVWAQTHKDYRGNLGPDKSIMLNAEDGGGLCALCNLEDEVLDKYFDSALKSHERQENRTFAVALFKKHGADKLLDDSTINQWCGSLSGIREIVTLAKTIPDEVKVQIFQDINRVDEPTYKRENSEMSI